MMSSVLILASVGVLSLKSAAGMMQDAVSEPESSEGANRALEVLFRDNFVVEAELKSTKNEPTWVAQPPLNHFVFDRYLMYVVIYIKKGRVHTFEGEAHTPLYGKVGHPNQHIPYIYENEHIPNQIVLTASGHGDHGEFVAQEITPYRSYRQLESLRIPTKNHSHFGYVFIAVKGTGNCYEAKLFWNLSGQRQTRGQVGPSRAAPESSEPGNSSQQ